MDCHLKREFCFVLPNNLKKKFLYSFSCCDWEFPTKYWDKNVHSKLKFDNSLTGYIVGTQTHLI